MARSETLEVALHVSELLARLGLEHLVGGSVASSLHGIPRATADIDLVVVLPGSRVPHLIAAFAPEFYIDQDMILEAIARRGCFNVIHLATLLKADLFVHDGSPHAVEELRRVRTVLLDDDPPRCLPVASPEDIVLQKLIWYRLGNQISDRQWGDVQGVLAVQGERLDQGYLDRWAAQLGVRELLERARQEAEGR